MEFETPAVVTDYDEVPYPGKFYPQSTPIRLATLAALFGMVPVPVDQCRVLELGCGDGGNLLPLAGVLPTSQFVGVDLSSTAVANGRARLAQVGLTNVHLCAQDLTDFSADSGSFDYIVAHGVYSWVPASVRQQILKICSRHLSPNGVAYISYNALPGGYLRRHARDLMLFHTRAMPDPPTKIREARNILEFAVSAHANRTVESEILKREIVANQKSDSFMYHDILGEVCDPVYFLDFLDQAAVHGLQFLAEAIPTVPPSALPAHVRSQLESLPDRRVREQYLDFIYCRRFRQTLLCRTGHQLANDYDPQSAKQLLIACSLKPTTPIPALNDTDVAEFRNVRGQTVKVQDAPAKAVFLALQDACPKAIAYEQLLSAACSRLGRDPKELPAEVESKILRLIMSSYLNGVVDLAIFQPAFVTSVSEKPLANAVVRMQAAAEGNIVTMALSSHTMADRFTRRLLSQLDGTRDRRQLLQQLAADPDFDAGQVTAETIGNSLGQLAAFGMLIG